MEILPSRSPITRIQSLPFQGLLGEERTPENEVSCRHLPTSRALPPSLSVGLERVLRVFRGINIGQLENVD